MKEFPRVSIVTPSFNQAAFLEETIHSVLGQDYPNLEYVIADGASTDPSLEIIRKFKDKIRWWVSEPDSGQGDAINKGMAHIGGDILGWINSDDTYLPGTVQAVVSVFQKNPDVGLVYADVHSINEKSEVFNTMRYKQYGLQDLMKFCIIGQTSVFFRRSVWEKSGGLDTSYHYLLDHQLWLKMAAQSRLLYVPQVWSCARYHKAAKNKAYPLGFGREAHRLVQWMQSQLELKPVYQQERSKVLAGANRLNGYYLSEGGLYFRSLQAYWKGFFQDAGTILHDWRRIAFNLFGLLGLGKVHKYYQNIRTKKNLVTGKNREVL